MTSRTLEPRVAEPVHWITMSRHDGCFCPISFSRHLTANQEKQ